jgi:Swt1-like HEPN
MADDSIRKILEISDAAVEAGRRFRGAGSLSATLAEQAMRASGMIASSSAMNQLASHHSALVEFAQHDRRMREVALEFTRPLAHQDLMEDMRRAGIIPRMAVGPFAELRDAGIFTAEQHMMENSFAVSARMLETFEAGFRLPSAIEAVRLAAEFEHSAMARALSSVAASTSVLAAMERMSTPWLDIANPLVSSASFAAIQEMANAVRIAPAFDVEIAGILRQELGDWREPLVWPKEIFEDVQARSSFYASLGVNPALTAMPAAAFRETLEVAGLVENFDMADEDSEEEGDVTEVAFSRTNEAHDKLQRLEVELRRFIEAVLSAEYGDQWAKRSVPGPTLDEWKLKKEKAGRHTEGIRPLIAFADFTDYERIICRRDNWKHFEVYFDRRESVLESLQRLYPIRIDTMHARMITQDDELFLLVEYKRLTRAMRKLRAESRS